MVRYSAVTLFLGAGFASLAQWIVLTDAGSLRSLSPALSIALLATVVLLMVLVMTRPDPGDLIGAIVVGLAGGAISWILLLAQMPVVAVLGWALVATGFMLGAIVWSQRAALRAYLHHLPQ